MALKKKPITRPALRTWVGLNEALMVMTNERKLEDLLRAELKGRKRPVFVNRICSRLNRVRAQNLAAELERAMK